MINSIVDLFSDIETSNEYEEQLKTRALELLPILKERPKNILMTGRTGTGKTLLASKMLNQFSIYGFSTFGININNLRQLSMDAINFRDKKETLQNVKNKIAKSQWVILDDLGAEKSNDSFEELIYWIAENRQNKGTIITTNLNYQSIKGKYDDRIISRLIPKDKDRIFIFDDRVLERRSA